MLRLQTYSGCRRPSVRGLWWLAVPLVLGWFLNRDACAQESPGIVYRDLGVVDIGSMAVLFPSLIYRPIDTFSSRPGGGAVGMGGAYLAVAEGVGAIGWSPSGLASLTHSEIMFDGRLHSAGGSALGYPDSVNVPRQEPLLVTSYSMNAKSTTQAGFVGAATPLFSNGSMNVVGALVWRRFGEIARPEEAITDLAFGRERSFPVVFTVDIRETGVIESYAPTLAVEIGRMISLGATLNILSGRLLSSYEHRLSSGGHPLIGHGRVSQRYSGLVPDLGAGVSLMNGRLRAAASFTPSHTLEVSGGDFYTRSVNIPNRPLLHSHGTAPDYDLDIPSALSVGLAFRPFRRLLLAADFNSQNWSETALEYTEETAEHRLVAGMNLEEDPGSTVPASLPLEDVSTVHIGAEYLLFDWNWAQIPIRLGFHQVPLSFRIPNNEDIEIVEMEGPGGSTVRQPVHSGKYHGDPVKADALSFGVSLRTGAFAYDFGLEHYSYTETKWFFDSVYEPVMNPGSRLVEHKRKITTIRLSSTMRF